ncbi:MAG: DUF6056 family protein [Oscillospiraceae bacterium]|jgi:hypothetical protein|nr:DUF6056 family protein [Oscillospiraceae bacterium]
MQNGIKKQIFNKKAISVVLVIIFLSSLIPLFVLANYDYPVEDDFNYADETSHVWRETHSIGAVIKAAAGRVQTTYNNWQGSFSGVFLMALVPSAFGERFYVLVPYIIILLFVFSYAFMLKVILINYLRADLHDFLIIAAVLIFISMQFAFRASEAFFWYNGGMYYTGFYAVLMLAAALLLLYIKSEKRLLSGLYMAFSALLFFALGGSDYIVALISFVLSGLFVLCAVFILKKKRLGPSLCLLASGAALIISAAAPGNAVRQAQQMDSMSAVPAVLHSFEHAAFFIIGAYVDTAALFAIIALSPLVYGLARKSALSFKFPGLFSFATYALFSSAFTPNLYSMASMPLARGINVCWYLYALLLLANIFYWGGWVSRKLKPAAQPGGKKSKRPDGIRNNGGLAEIFSTLLTAFFLVTAFFQALDSPDSITSVSAVKSLVIGEAQAYYQENLERERLYKDPGIQDVQIRAFFSKPPLLYTYDLTQDPSHWKNKFISSYYDKKSVTIVPDANR